MKKNPPLNKVPVNPSSEIYNMGTSLPEIIKLQKHLFNKASSLVSKKGHDYNRRQQIAGDTLFSIRVARILGVVDRDTQSVLVRICDKVNRLVSLENPEVSAKIKDERIEDTVVDLINYVTYFYAIYLGQKKRNLKGGN